MCQTIVKCPQKIVYADKFHCPYRHLHQIIKCLSMCVCVCIVDGSGDSGVAVIIN